MNKGLDRAIYFVSGALFAATLGVALLVYLFMTTKQHHARRYVNEDGWLYEKEASGAKKQVVVCQ